MGKALVLNAHAKYGLVAIRQLGAQGIRVTAGSSRWWNPGRMSKYADGHLTYPSPETDPEEFVRAIERELASGEYDMLLPVNERTVELVTRHASRFEQHTTVPFLPHERLLAGLDKRRTIEAAREFDIPTPKTLVSGGADLDDVEATLEYPIVVKPQWGSSRSGISICRSSSELARVSQRTKEEYGPVLFQEFVPHGGERGVYTLYGDSAELLGLTVQERLRSYPPEGGASTYRETVEDPELVTLADKLLSKLDWWGLAMVEFRIDARTGEPQLMEINPRLWGSLSLSAFAGVNFPYLLYRLTVDGEVEPQLEYDVGVRSRCLFTDAQQVFARDDTFRAFREFLTPSSKPCRYDIVLRSDPRPTLGQFAYWLTVFLDRRNDRPSFSQDAGRTSSPTPSLSDRP